MFLLQPSVLYTFAFANKAFRLLYFQAFESEKKVKLISFLKRQQPDDDLRAAFQSITRAEESEENEFESAVDDFLPEFALDPDETFDDKERDVLVFIAGYIAHKGKFFFDCELCAGLLRHSSSKPMVSRSGVHLWYQKKNRLFSAGTLILHINADAWRSDFPFGRSWISSDTLFFVFQVSLES